MLPHRHVVALLLATAASPLAAAPLPSDKAVDPVVVAQLSPDKGVDPAVVAPLPSDKSVDPAVVAPMPPDKAVVETPPTEKAADPAAVAPLIENIGVRATAPGTPGRARIPASAVTAPIIIAGLTRREGEVPASAPVRMEGSYDYNLTIPLELANLPSEISSARVSCDFTRAATPLAPDPAVLDLLLANLGRSVMLTNGGYRGSIGIGVNANPGYDPATGQLYNCQVELLGMSRGSPVTYRPRRRYRGAPWEFDPPLAFEGTPDVRGIFP